jgi:RimJ/RimL family protein N-acetyltransferase
MIEWEGQPIGECNYQIQDGYAEIGIKICRAECQNQGIGRKVLRSLIKTLFEMRDADGVFMIKKIVLDTNLKNTRAQHVYEQLGFQKMRVNVDSWQDQLGEWQSSVDYELERELY